MKVSVPFSAPALLPVHGASSQDAPRSANLAASRRLAEGPGGLFEGLRQGAVVADCSTISPSVSRRLAAEAARRGASWLDAPCTGSKAGAESGNLTFMIGGEQAVFERVREYFLPMGKKLYYVGSNGMGLHAKLTQNLVLALTYWGVCEGLVLAAKAGVPPRLMYDIIQNSAARAGILEYKAPSVFRGSWATNFSLKWMYKDITLMLETGRELGVPLPGLSVVHELFGANITRGHGEDDYASVITLLEDWRACRSGRKSRMGILARPRPRNHRRGAEDTEKSCPSAAGASLARRPHALVRPRATDEREVLRVLYGFDGKVNLKLRPVQMLGMEQLDIQKLPDGHVLEPSEAFKR